MVMTAGIVMDPTISSDHGGSEAAGFVKPEEGWEWALREEINGSYTVTLFLTKLFVLGGATLLVLC